MKRIYLISLLLTIAMGLVSVDMIAGNWQRAGQAGASQLLINPWARSSGWGDANVACVIGAEGIHQNVAGLAFTKKTELTYTNSQYFVGTGIQVNSAALSTRIGDAGALGVSVEAFNWGEIEKTTEALPDGGIGTYKPSYTVIGLSYAREFSNSIYGGLTVKLINETMSDVKSSGFALDAGIQYITGFGKDKAGNRKRDNLHFGITLKNVGTTMKYSGDGMAFVGLSPTGTSMSVENRSQEFELPSLIRIGFSYHVKLAPKVDEEEEIVTSDHNLAIALNFTSNSFTNDQFNIGVEYGFREYLFLRAGYTYEKGLHTMSRTTVFTGPSAGITLQCPLKKKTESTVYGTSSTESHVRSVLAIDYSYRFTNPFGGVHTFGVRVSL